MNRLLNTPYMMLTPMDSLKILGVVLAIVTIASVLFTLVELFKDWMNK
jgi:hypothetical protein